MVSLDLVPAISVIIGIIGVAYKSGQIVQKLNQLVDEVKEVKTDMREVKKQKYPVLIRKTHRLGYLPTWTKNPFTNNQY